MNGSQLVSVDYRELVPALFFIVLGGFFLINAVFVIGFAGDNGSGSATFPTLISATLLLIGLVLLVRSFGRAAVGFTLLAWPRLLAILAAPVLFGLTVRPLGLLPAIVLSLICTSVADSRSSLRSRAPVVAAVTAICIVIFHYGLRLPFPLVQGLRL